MRDWQLRGSSLALCGDGKICLFDGADEQISVKDDDQTDVRPVNLALCKWAEVEFKNQLREWIPGLVCVRAALTYCKKAKMKEREMIDMS